MRVGRKRVERIMREHSLQGAFLRRGWKGGSTKQNPRHTAAPDLVNRQFNAEGPNRLWVADLTRIMTGEGVLWLASVRDAFSNKVVGWHTAARADTDLPMTALNHGLRSRNVRAGNLVHHSDKGCQGGFNGLHLVRPDGLRLRDSIFTEIVIPYNAVAGVRTRVQTNFGRSGFKVDRERGRALLAYGDATARLDLHPGARIEVNGEPCTGEFTELALTADDVAGFVQSANQQLARFAHTE